jgi:hypothetical protein
VLRVRRDQRVRLALKVRPARKGHKATPVQLGQPAHKGLRESRAWPEPQAPRALKDHKATKDRPVRRVPKARKDRRVIRLTFPMDHSNE